VYRRLNPLLFAAQLAVSVGCLWSRSTWLLEFHSLVELRFLGAALLAAGLWLTAYALRHLRDNYSPCYDSHLPHALVTTGPYAVIRHPMYLAKLLAATGSLLFSGSLWLLPSAAYVCVTTVRALRREDAELVASMPGYADYATRTRVLVPCWL
jgi:protein-S-isoprenylcysteine O-methyltransferase Ste14